jgi:hypothetical protein
LNGNRFGQYFFDNLAQLATKAVKEYEKPNLEQQALASGRPVVDLERERRAIFADARVLHGNFQPKAQFKNPNFREYKKKKKKKRREEEKEVLYEHWLMITLLSTGNKPNQFPPGNGRNPPRGGYRGGHNNNTRGGNRNRGQQNANPRPWPNDNQESNSGAPPSNRGGRANNNNQQQANNNNNRKFSHGKGRGGN